MNDARALRLVHDIRLTKNAKRERPFGLEPWEKRGEGQRELDMRIGEAVAATEFKRTRGGMAERSRLSVPARTGIPRYFCYLMAEEADHA